MSALLETVSSVRSDVRIVERMFAGRHGVGADQAEHDIHDTMKWSFMDVLLRYPEIPRDVWLTVECHRHCHCTTERQNNVQDYSATIHMNADLITYTLKFRL